MSAVTQAPRQYLRAVAVLWLVLAAACIALAIEKDIPIGLAVPLAAAILLEAAAYLVPGFPDVRDWLAERLSPSGRAGLLTLAAVAPYIAYTVPSGLFLWWQAVAIAGVGAAVAFWFLVLPRSAVVDVGFVLAIAALVLAKLFPLLYPRPMEGIPAEFLGQVMVIRTGILAVEWFRREPGVEFGFWPTAGEWQVGVTHFVLLVAVVGSLGYGLGFFTGLREYDEWWVPVLTAAATFLGMLWVVALSEEYFFRGLLQQWVSRWTGSTAAGLVTVSILFGAAHLPFRDFPNWRFALLAAVAGLFYGSAFVRGQGIRAAMVAHALTNVVWRVFLIT